MINNSKVLPEPTRNILTRRNLNKFFTYLWVLIVVLGIGYYFSINYKTFLSEINKISIFQIVLSALFLWIGKLFVCQNSRLAISENLDKPIGYFFLYYLYTVTDIAKYIPGGIWAIISRISAYALVGINIKTNLKTFIIENSWLIGWSLVLGLAFSYNALVIIPDTNEVLSFISTNLVVSFREKLKSIGIVPIWILMISIGILGTFVVNLIWSNKRFSKRKSLKILATNLGSTTSLGLSIGILLPNLSVASIPLTLGAFALARAAGYIAFFAPAGIGVRELIFTLVLSHIWSLPELIAIMTLYRFLTMIVEFILFGIVFYIGKDLRIALKQKNNSAS